VRDTFQRVAFTLLHFNTFQSHCPVPALHDVRLFLTCATDTRMDWLGYLYLCRRTTGCEPGTLGDVYATLDRAFFRRRDVKYHGGLGRR